ncbi:MULTISPECIES: hypothetical protein [Anaerotruncus]|jgi:hypothetical protein|uniref:hypothetical protein n=1 Tax=Anaerotruncus TaxID=244127 RepID=UPI000B1FB506|nr:MULTISPECIES: hypothetical protein [Anaerotruncus]
MGKEKSFSLRIDEELLREFRYVCGYYGRSANGQLIFMIRKLVEQFKKQNGEIELPDE